jgi:carbonic anhydrase
MTFNLLPTSALQFARAATLSRLLSAAALAFIASAATAATPAAPPPTREVQAATTPEEVLQRLMAGNARFVAGQVQSRDWSEQRRLTAGGQNPLAVVLSCLDSRVPAEVVFDQGLGDLFSARVAGNVLNDDILGSMEFACQAAGARLIVVLGHTACGAVKGAATGAELGHLTGLLAKIRPAVGSTRERDPASPPGAAAFVDSVAEMNVQQVRRAIGERSAVLRGLIESGRVTVVGAMYDLASGRVTVLPPQTP